MKKYPISIPSNSIFQYRTSRFFFKCQNGNSLILGFLFFSHFFLKAQKFHEKSLILEVVSKHSTFVLSKFNFWKNPNFLKFFYFLDTFTKFWKNTYNGYTALAWLSSKFTPRIWRQIDAFLDRFLAVLHYLDWSSCLKFY